MKKFFRSLLAKYMLIILTAIFLVQMVTFIMLSFFLIAQERMGEGVPKESEVEQQWHEEAANLEDESQIFPLFNKWKKLYPEAGMFFVDGQGNLSKQLDAPEGLPEVWTPAFTAKFIKDRYGGDPFTVIAFVKNDEKKGFIVFEISREYFAPPAVTLYDRSGEWIVLAVIAVVLIFIGLSFLFFRGIRKRLVYLQGAMMVRDGNELPVSIEVKKMDEIGQLEETFNKMVHELRESKERQQKEEQLRRELIANLSHDLRTPLTKIQAQTYSLQKEKLSPEGEKALKALDASIKDVDQLIENLMSYTLLMANKYKFEAKKINIVRFVRERMAAWYPVFEKEGYEIEIDLHPFQENEWVVDPIWFSRILDNLLQNVLRHAESGKYVGVKTESTDEFDAIVIMDRGKGFKNESDHKGAGIGLSIVDMMVRGMKLDWDIESSGDGTKIKVKRHK